MTHRELCLLGAKYMKNRGIKAFDRCKYVAVELERIGECPDIWGVCSGYTQLIEVKVSRSDFLSDKKKFWRANPEHGLGMFRSYLCPEGIIKETDLPAYWGLLYVNECGKITEIVKPVHQRSSIKEELNLMQNLMRRSGLKSQIFDFKNYKNK